MKFWRANDWREQLATKADIAEFKAVVEKSQSKLLQYLDNLHTLVVDAQEKRITSLENKVRFLLEKSGSHPSDNSF